LGVLGLLAWAEFALRIVWPAAWLDPWRGAAYWVAAKLAVQGKAELLYADQGRVFAEESARLGTRPDIFHVNVPTTVLPFVPLTPLPVDTAGTIWTLFSVVCTVAALLLLLRELRLPLPLALAISAVVPIFQPLRSDIFRGQAYTQLLLLVVAGSIWASRLEADNSAHAETKPPLSALLSGCAFALASVVKQIYGMAQLFAPLLRRQWTVAITTLGVYGAIAAATLLWLGVEPWVEGISNSLGWREKPETAVTAYQSLNNFLTHLFRFHPTLNPGPLADLPWLVGPLWWALAIAILALSAWPLLRYRSGSTNTARRLLPYTLATPVALLLSPVSEDYHYTQTLFPLIVLTALIWETSRDARSPRTLFFTWGPLLALLVLLALPWRFYNVPGTEGWRAFIYYPRFYGNLLLWVVLLILLVRVPQKEATEHSLPVASSSVETRGATAP
jgi:hypothetical protein